MRFRFYATPRKGQSVETDSRLVVVWSLGGRVGGEVSDGWWV